MLRMFLIWLGGCIWFFSNMILQPRKVSNERIFRIGAKTGRFDENAYYRTKEAFYDTVGLRLLYFLRAVGTGGSAITRL